MSIQVIQSNWNVVARGYLLAPLVMQPKGEDRGLALPAGTLVEVYVGAAWQHDFSRADIEAMLSMLRGEPPEEFVSEVPT